jgi:hypothetical protein
MVIMEIQVILLLSALTLVLPILLYKNGHIRLCLGIFYTIGAISFGAMAVCLAIHPPNIAIQRILELGSVIVTKVLTPIHGNAARLTMTESLGAVAS